MAFFYGNVINYQKNNQNSFVDIFTQRGWKYFLISFIDVQANCLIVYAYQFTSLISIQVLKLSINLINVYFFNQKIFCLMFFLLNLSIKKILKH